ncbi:hypothetical protein HMPREF1347_02335 [Enterococcus faecium 504]|nr:hypothetical protein HMPREF1347_02335 [Enterococcus faecium 504]
MFDCSYYRRCRTAFSQPLISQPLFLNKRQNHSFSLENLIVVRI